MRRIAQLTALIASSAIMLTSSVVEARMGTKKEQKKENMSAAVDFQTFDLDGQVHDLMWCGYQDEIVLMHTTEGSIYRSRDRGLSWKRLQSLLHKQAFNVADEDQDIGIVHRMIQSPQDDQLVIFIGTNGINWVSEDCGGSIKGLNSGKRIQEFLFHPTQRSWALAASWTTCAEFGDEPCRIYKELYHTKDMGENWNYVTNYVFDFEWGQSQIAIDNKVVIPDERVWVTRDATNTKHQSHSKRLSWSVDIDLYYSDDFFETSVMALEQGNTIIKTPQYMFVSCSNEDQLRVNIFSATYRSGFTNLKKARLPAEALLTTTFTLMDTSEEQVFLFLENKGMNTPFGSVYISDANGRSFSSSLTNVIKGQAVDFERVTSLDGTFIANKYSPPKQQARRQKQHEEEKLDAFIDEFEEDWDEADMIAEESRHAQSSRMGSTMNRKQQETEDQIFHIKESIPALEVQENVKTFITHNKGAKWELIKAPEVSYRGKKSACYIEDGCSLHLEIYSHNGELAPVYSTEKAIGLVLGTGNIGAKLTDNESQKSLYLSRDGGLTWSTIRIGVHIYEIGDHGALIVIAQKNTPTTFIEFSWDEGQSWDILTISDRELYVENIIIEPNSISQQFMVYGTYAEEYHQFIDESEDDIQIDIEKGNEAFLVYVDFSQLHEPQCKGADNAGTDDSDYELWTPHDGRFGDQKCFLGQHKTFVRRKQDSKCYNGEEHEAVTRVEPCTCNEMDYECDLGYARSEGGGPCLENETRLLPEEIQRRTTEMQAEQCEEFGYYEVTTGYRKIPGNICEGGIDLNPYRYQCSSSGYIASWFTFRGIFMLGVMGVLCYYGWPIIEAILLLLPVPDPSEMKDKASEYGSKAVELVKNVPGMLSGDSARGAPIGQYQQFGAPGAAKDDSDSNDEDEEDIGKEANQQQNALDYDSDEKDDSTDGANQELISLDGGADKRKKVPKLKKPSK